MRSAVKKDRALLVLLGILLGLYLAGICLVNLSTHPKWYDSDMYLDVLYASKAWEEKSLFPENWMFGNQYYVVTTPALAALLCNLWEPQTAMAVASSLVSALVAVSFLWLMQAAGRSKQAGLAGAVFLFAAVLYFGDAHRDYNGWHLMFTMASYYGVYLVNGFLAFGCYLRAGDLPGKKILPVLILACLLSFGTGMQSLRQTAVMTCPLIAMEILRWIGCRIGRHRWEKEPLIVAGTVSLSNVLGLVVIRMLDVPRSGVQVAFSMPTLGELAANAVENVKFAYKVFAIGGRFQLVFFWLMAGLCLLAVIRMTVRGGFRKEGNSLAVLLLFGIGLGAVFAAGTLALLAIRMPYYFMVYPMMAFLMACAYDALGHGGMGLVLTSLLLMLCLSWPDYHRDVIVPLRDNEKASYVEVADYLVENGYTTVYSEWDNCGEDVAVASGCALEAAFWPYEFMPYESIKMLCDTTVYSEDPRNCVYLFRGADRAELGKEGARKRGAELTQTAYFPDLDLYVFTAPVNLMDP